MSYLLPHLYNGVTTNPTANYSTSQYSKDTGVGASVKRYSEYTKLLRGATANELMHINHCFCQLNKQVT